MNRGVIDMRRRIEVEIERGDDKSVREEDRHHKPQASTRNC